MAISWMIIVGLAKNVKLRIAIVVNQSKNAENVNMGNLLKKEYAKIAFLGYILCLEL